MSTWAVFPFGISGGCASLVSLDAVLEDMESSAQGHSRGPYVLCLAKHPYW